MPSNAVTQNPQAAHTGNLGDIYKHASLVALARMLAGRWTDGRVNWLDTHAFQYEARLANVTWTADMAPLCATHRGYDDYRALEQPHVSAGRYLCSTGLIRQCLPCAHLHLSESHTETREMLRRQLEERGLAPAALLSDAVQWSASVAPLRPGHLLALLDPFYLTPSSWTAGWEAVRRLTGPSHEGVLLCFDSADDGGAPRWQGPPLSAWRGPISVLSRTPFFLAVYATEAVAPDVAEVLEGLDWPSGGFQGP